MKCHIRFHLLVISNYYTQPSKLGEFASACREVTYSCFCVLIVDKRINRNLTVIGDSQSWHANETSVS